MRLDPAMKLNSVLSLILRRAVQLVLVLVMGMPAALAQVECTGCLCPGNPCKLCPLPPSKNIPPAPDEPGTCLRIRENVPAVSADTDPDTHYASLDRSIMECVRNGGDVVMNSRRNKEFPSKHYCKPYTAQGRTGMDRSPSPDKK